VLRLLKGASSQTARLVGAALAVALAVTLLSGTFALTQTIDTAVHDATAPPVGAADVIVRSTAESSADGAALPERQSVPASLLARVAAVPGVGRAWGAVQGYAQLLDARGKAISAKGLRTVATGWEPGDRLSAGRAPRGIDEVAVDAETARTHGLRVGERVKVLLAGATREFTIGGLVRRAGNLVASTKTVFAPSVAQQLLGRQDQVDSIGIRSERGVGPAALRARINAALPDRYEAITADDAAGEARQSWARALGFLPTGLAMFAAVAMVVGALLIFNTFSILLAQRRPELNLLRSLGASRSQLVAMVMIEALAVGTLASGAGTVLGFGAARVLLALMNNLGVDLPRVPVGFRAGTALMALGSGVLVTVVAVYVPVRRAVRATLISQETIEAGEGYVSTRRRLETGGGAVAVGATLIAVGLNGIVTSPVVVLGVGSCVFVAGLGILSPLVSRPAARLVGSPLAGLLGEPAILGRQNAMRNPRRTAATASALMIGISLIGVVAIVAASMRTSAKAAVEKTLRADFVLAPVGTSRLSGGMPTAVAARLRRAPGMEIVSEIRAGQWSLNGTTKTLVAIDPGTATRLHDVDSTSAAAVRHLGDKGILVRGNVAEHRGWRVGDHVPLTFARTGTRTFRIDGLFSTTAVRTDYVISLNAFVANFAQQLDAEVDVKLAAGVTPAAGRRLIQKAMVDLPVARVMDRGQVLAVQEGRLDRLLVGMTALLALSVLIALLGITNTLALSVHERARELGMLRAIGMARRQLRSMICAEALILAALGAVMGVLVAGFFGWVLVRAMGNLGVTTLVVPIRQLGGLVAVATSAGWLAGVMPARRAGRLAVLDAVTGR